MRGLWVLCRWDLRRDRAVFAALAAGLGLFQLLVVWLARYLAGGGTFEVVASIVPPLVRRAIGFDVALLLSFQGAVGLGYFHPVVIASLVAAATIASRSAVAEVERGTAALLLARPVARRVLVLRGLAETACAAIALPGAMLAGTLGGLTLIGRLGQVSLVPYVALAVNDAALVLAFGSLFGLIGTTAPNARAGVVRSVGYAFTAYLVSYLARLWSPLELVAPLSLFSYFEPGPVLAGVLPLRNVAILFGGAAASAIAALVAIERRDLA